jgi:hypothetical protein
MSRRRLILLVVLLAAAVCTALVLSGFSLKGRTVTVTHAAVTATYLDLGAPGPSVGDERLFEMPTFVRAGKITGRMDAIMTTTGENVPEQGAEIRSTQLVFTFAREEDQLVVAGTATYPAAGATLAQDTATVRPIVGGSGAYAGAGGWCESTHLTDGTWRHVFHLER